MLIIGGSTATGKSGLAVAVAKAINGEIISADSMQIYKYMDIGTAKVTEEEKNGIKHYLIDIIEPTQSFSVAEYAKLAKKTIEEIKLKGKVPVIVGGTGLYINSLIYDYKLSKQDLQLRENLINDLNLHGKEYMYNKLQQIDPISAATIHPNNTKRVIRALEVFYLTKTPIVDKSDKQECLPHTIFAVNMDRQMLYDNINTRVEQMFESGLQNELNFLLKEKNLNFSMQSMQAIGYKEFSKYYDGQASNLEEIKEEIKKNTRNYAKRQTTWFKSIPTVKWLDYEHKSEFVDIICNYYYKNMPNL